MTGTTATGLPLSSSATNVKYADKMWRTSHFRGSSHHTFTPTSIDVWKTLFTLDFKIRKLANVDRMQEAHVVDCGGHCGPTGVSLSRQSGAQIDQVQDVAAQHISEHVRIVRQGDICVLGAGLPNRATVQDRSFRLDCTYAHDL